MKKQVRLSAESRSHSGTPAARRMRREGQIPAVVYGHGEPSTSLTLRADEFDRLESRIHIATTVIGLEVDDGDAMSVLIREVQRHPFRSEVLHVDFFQLTEGETIRVEVPIHLEGEPKGAEEGGILQQTRHELAVECLPDDIPEGFTVDVSEMVIGDVVHVGDIDVGEVTVLDDPDLTVCSMVPPTIITVDEEEDEDLEPELVGEEGEEEGDAEASGEAGDEDEGGEED